MTPGSRTQPSSGPPHLHPRRVLLIDSDQDALDMYAAHLGLAGQHVLSTTDPLRAWELALNGHPDVIVIDVRLRRGFDGLELTQRLRVHASTADIPVLVLTGFVFPHHDTLAMAAGCSGYLTKPCAPETLLGEIERADPRKRARPAAAPREQLA